MARKYLENKFRIFSKDIQVQFRKGINEHYQNVKCKMLIKFERKLERLQKLSEIKICFCTLGYRVGLLRISDILVRYLIIELLVIRNQQHTFTIYVWHLIDIASRTETKKPACFLGLIQFPLHVLGEH